MSSSSFPKPPMGRLILSLSSLWIICNSISSTLAGVASSSASCEFPSEWAGKWFQSGVVHLITINATHMETKGKCVERDMDKFLIHEYTSIEDCYRCVVINQRHPSVLQFKETYCVAKAPLREICEGITGDAPLFSMFRSDPPAEPVPCPFKGAPFTFTYNRGSGDCVYPLSRAESCTDDSRLVLKYQACPDVRSTESNVEQLICLAEWKEGSTRYMVGRVLQQDRHNTLVSDEDQYRCFVYERITHQGGGGSSSGAVSTAGGGHRGGGVTYIIAQSGDASCSGVQSVQEGSRTIKLTTVDDHHNRCRFPVWLTEHHTWHSLDHRLSYRFSQRNATLRVKSAENATPAHHHSAALSSGDANPGPYHAAHTASGGSGSSHSHHHTDNFHNVHLAEGGEVRLVCHSILQALEKKKVQIVAHVTAGCKSGYVCMVFHKRDNNVIEVQQSEKIEENSEEACRSFDPINTAYTTLITTSLHPKKCPHLGRYTVVNSLSGIDRRKRRQNSATEGSTSSRQECLSPTHESLSVGCGSSQEMEQKSSCSNSQAQTISAYSCHGSWEENGTSYLIVSPIGRKSTDPSRYCFIYNFVNGPVDQSLSYNNNNGQSSSSLNGIYSNNGAVGKSNNNNNNQVAAGIGGGNVLQRGGLLQLTAFADNCHRLANSHDFSNMYDTPANGWTMNLTFNGTCADTDDGTNTSNRLLPPLVFLISLIMTIAIVR